MAAPKVDYHKINSLKAKVYDCMARIEDAMAIVEQCKKEISQHNAAISDELQKQKAAPDRMGK